MTQGTTQILFLVVIVAAFYFLIIRPQQQRSKQQQEMLASLEPGVEIMTVGGIYATIVTIEGDRILAELYDGTQLELAKRAIASVLPAKPAADDEEPEAQENEADEPVMADEHDEESHESQDAPVHDDGGTSDARSAEDKGDAPDA